MKNFQPYEEVVAALKESERLIVSGEQGEERIARREAYDPDKPRSEVAARTAYVKGFGEEKPSTQFDVEAFFSRFEVVEAVRLRRNNVGEFKGSVYVIFQNPEQMEKFLALDPKPQWQNEPLEIRSKRDYCEEKNQLIREGKIAPQSERNSFWGPYDNNRGGRGGRGGRGRGQSRGRGEFSKRPSTSTE